MKKSILVLAVLALASSAYATAVTAYANAIGLNGGQKAFSRTIDANGQPVEFNDDKPWNVFELAYSATAAQITDNRGLAPKTGILGKVCVESGPLTNPWNEVALVWDAASTAPSGTALAMSTLGRRLLPPLPRASGTMACSPQPPVQFTSGLVVGNSGTAGSTYVYWK